MHVCVIIPAAGRSERFGSTSKLTEDFGGRPLLIRTVECFSRRDECRSIVVATPPAGSERTETFHARFGGTLSFHGVTLVEGSDTSRFETVSAALAAVPSEADWIAVHDAARPAVGQDLLDRVFAAAASGCEAIVPAVPVTGTVRRGDAATERRGGEADDVLADAILGDAGRVDVTVRRAGPAVDRAHLWEMQTPQLVRAELMRAAYASAASAEETARAGFTDDAAVVQAHGGDVFLVPGDRGNIKVTTPDDLSFLRRLDGAGAVSEGDARGSARGSAALEDLF